MHIFFFLFCQAFAITALATTIRNHPRSTKQIWQPKQGSRFQIILDRAVLSTSKSSSSRPNSKSPTTSNASKGKPEVLIPENAEIFDVDLFDTPASLIQTLQDKGKWVICYFSAGGSESWRSDYDDFRKRDLGDKLRNWEKERWLDIRSDDVFKVMRRRIEMAYKKGCDGIDPDNVDAFADEHSNGGGFKLTRRDSIDFIKRLADEAHYWRLAMGLKNAEAIIPNVTSHIEFAVNEECATYYGGCQSYEPFLNSGKPVFHIEYVRTKVRGEKVELRPESDGNRNLRDMDSTQLKRLYCLERGMDEGKKWIGREVGSKISTVIKGLQLNKWVLYCDGTSAGDAEDAR